ncbi:MAG: WXG100 family type VII secretion target [Pseudonocardiales bacterium]
MTTYTGAEDVIPGDLDGLDSAVGTISAAADGASSLSEDLRKAVDSTADFWASPSGTTYRVSAQKQIGSAAMLVGPLDTASQAFGTLARELRGARSIVERALADSVALGMGPTDLVGNPFAVLGFMFRNPQHAPMVAGLLGDIAGARVSAGSAHTAFTASLSGVRDGIGGADERLLGSRRGPDERGGRRIDEDERRGREPGGDGDGHFDNDWAGLAILERYLRGGDDWTITDDPEWSEYMKNNGMLSDQLQGWVQTEAQEALDNYLVTGAGRGEFDERFSAQMENGEGIVGYQYLHGTERNAGHFQFEGNTEVRPRGDGTYEVTVNSGYTWNDRIDPNPQYETDTWKSRLAEVFTLG